MAARAPVSRAAGSPPPLVLADGTVEALKWLALVSMTGDHVNGFLLGGTWPALFAAGWLALPLFAVVLAYNLARPEAAARGLHRRALARLVLAGALASPPYLALGGACVGWWPLNAMFLLALVTLVALRWEGSDGRPAQAVALLLVGGVLVEYCWAGAALGVAVWRYCRRPTWLAAVAVLAAGAGLCWINGNLWAFAALPLLAAATRLDLPVPRWRWVFYAYYPLHLAALWLIQRGLEASGAGF